MNLDGKLEWGEVFPDGKVPVQTIGTQKPILEGAKDVESVFTVNWKELTPRQQQAIIEKLSKQSDATKEAVLTDILRIELPLRRKYTVCCGKVGCDYSFGEGDFLFEREKEHNQRQVTT